MPIITLPDGTELSYDASVTALEVAGVIVKTIENAADVAETVYASARLAFESYRPVAVLIGQRVIGFKEWDK